jgi:hypothetical protein
MTTEKTVSRLPLIGAICSFWPKAADAENEDLAPRPATIADVTDPTAGSVRVNISFLAADGSLHARRDVPLYESGDRPTVAYVELPATVGKSTKSKSADKAADKADAKTDNGKK